ncbi:hypothetical protein NQ317_003472 [Molorchus minor]|uniref:Multidrug resistance-associated protein lethal(2)03659 n=1 Tax=Molorchus minor TaxID=1323400 RepID=A0ABQ9K0J6_9CUCU|nr:hypothetical protein NQ317_003472 [Molorchus minor]
MDEDKDLLNKEKKRHPYEKASILSKTFFCWLLPDFVKGYKRQLTEDDLYGALKTHESKLLGDKLQYAWENQINNKKKASLLAAICKVFYLELVLYGILFLIQEFVVKLSQPLLISKFLRCLESTENNAFQSEMYIYGALIVLFSLINVMCIHIYYFVVMHLGMKIRIAVCSLIYRKALKLERSALEKTTVGQMVNLLSNDVGKFDFAVTYIYNFWVTPIETGVIMYFLYQYVGPTGLVGVCFLILFMFPQMFMGKKISQYRSRIAKCTDERVHLMGEILNGIQVIKMYNWEKSFAKLVVLSRKMEMKQIWAASIIRAIMNTCITVLHRTAIYLCVLTYILTGNIINATYVYTISSFYGILRQILTLYIPRAVSQFAETKTSLNRIQHFLSHQEIALNKNANIELNRKLTEDFKSKDFDEGTVHLENVSVKPQDTAPEYLLKNITFDVIPGQLVAIVGKVGSGKTTLLHTILREFVPVEGSVHVSGSISYASQEPWLFEGTIRQNIIFGENFNIEKYNEVVKACDLEKDFSSFPYKDQSLVGALSGGQRARVNLARALYKNAEVYLLDDPLSSVDARVGKHLFNECICGYLKGKCVVLVTNQLQYLKNVHNIYLIQNGKIQGTGAYDELKQVSLEFSELLMEHKDEEKQANESVVIEREIKSNYNKSGEKQTEEKEQRSSGKISKSVYTNYLRAGGSCCSAILVLTLFFVAQVLASVADYFIILWTNLEQWRCRNGIRGNCTEMRQWNAEGNVTRVNLLNDTISANDQKPLLAHLHLIMTDDVSLIVYTIIVTLFVILSLTRSIYFFKYCLKASTKLHNIMFDKISKAPMIFFNTNPSGRILNRFSKDIGIIDEILPMTISDTLQIALILLSVSVVVGCLYISILIPTAIIVLIFYYIRMVFLATSRDLKRIEAATRSPIYTHLRSSVQGLPTIRAFQAQDVVQREFDNYQDQYTAASFMFLGANRTFGFWLDFHCVVYTALCNRLDILVCLVFYASGIVMYYTLILFLEMFGGDVGFALTEAVGLTGMFQFGIRQWSEMENQMTSVERIDEYIEVASEEDENTRDTLKIGQRKGILNLIMSALDIPVGIHTTTGAGKSSIVAALFRLVNTDGKIVIDNIDVKQLGLSTLRSKISVIPQEPVLFSTTIRKNLDPFDEFSDDVLWNALENVNLKSAIGDLSNGLYTKLTEGGSNLSVGQRQLLCLARAIVRNNKILVLDEATANVDPYTDELIQMTIREKFADCTVLTIAHRLYTIMDSDRVLVMDGGRAVEYDHPYKLLLNKDGIFYGLVSQTGVATTDFLQNKAKQYYDKYNCD